MKRTTRITESIEKLLEEGMEEKRPGERPGEWTQGGTVAGTLLSGFSKRRARPLDGSSAVVCGAECGVRFHPLHPFARIFPSSDEERRRTINVSVPFRKSWLPGRDKVDLYPFDQREARSAYAGTNLRFRKSTKTSTYVLLAFRLSVGRERDRAEERGMRDLCEIEVARLYRFRYDEQKCRA
ncbi:acetyl- acetyltransferase [Lasius niger]|uniref:Acetyl-acetyltransferase n=1 Tax=Lasius niger TaxID=67767 RepID=A0A0J7KV07_LASNI|nr:acetyl- acetyltransferase [Lasius niger]